MVDVKSSYKKIKKEYLKFLKSQEVLTEPFRDKIGQLNKFYLPISKKIFETSTYFMGNDFFLLKNLFRSTLSS